MPDARPPSKVGVVFSGGPAPGANAVIAAAASAFRRDGIEVIGFMHGYEHLQTDHGAAGMDESHYRTIEASDLRGLRNARGVFVGTGRANPGRLIGAPEHLEDAERTAPLRVVYENLIALGIEALVSIGGDDTLKTGNLLYEFQRRLPPDAPRVRIVHLPKTIDNDYRGIDFTFGFFTAVDVMAKELQNLRADAIATNSYFIVETMGRKSGWLAYGVAIAGEAHMVLGVEDVVGKLSIDGRVDLDALTDHVVELILVREQSGRGYGTVVLAEGLSELLPEEQLHDVPRDEHGHLSLRRIDLGALVADRVAKRFKERTGRDKKLVGVQLGYEARCAAPHAFDVMLGCQLGVGAYRALVEEGLDGHMVSVAGQLDLLYVPFAQLVDPATLKTDVRFIARDSDFHRLARQLETRVRGSR